MSRPEQAANLIQDALRQAIEVGEIIGDGQDVERALAVSGRDGHRIAGKGGVEVDGKPSVVFEVAHLRKEDVQVGSGIRGGSTAATSAEARGDDAVAGDFDLGDVLKALVAERLDQARGGDDPAAGLHEFLGLGDEVLVVAGGRREEDGGSVGWEIREPGRWERRSCPGSREDTLRRRSCRACRWRRRWACRACRGNDPATRRNSRRCGRPCWACRWSRRAAGWGPSAWRGQVALVSWLPPRLPAFSRSRMICMELNSMISGTLAKKVSQNCSA